MEEWWAQQTFGLRALLVQAYTEALQSGDWRAGQDILNRELGTPTQRHELEDVSRREIPDDALEKLADLKRQLEQAQGQ